MASKARSTKSLSRRRPSRNSRDRALIVCEGEKTEPKYLKDFIYALGLTSADVKICGEECGSDPKSIYLYAMEVFRRDGDYDALFCVFDRDGHTTFDWACQRIACTKLSRSQQISCIKSIPCFEYWILLHFVHSTSPIAAVGGKSSGQRALAEVKKYMPSYEKGGHGVYDATKEKLAEAIKRSKLVVSEATKSGADNPMTLMHQLIEHLTEMAKTKV